MQYSGRRSEMIYLRRRVHHVPIVHPIKQGDSPKQFHLLPQGAHSCYTFFMPQSTLTTKFQTTIPVEVREALNLKPRQRGLLRTALRWRRRNTARAWPG